jgi:hypothetical protein
VEVKPNPAAAGHGVFQHLHLANLLFQLVKPRRRLAPIECSPKADSICPDRIVEGIEKFGVCKRSGVPQRTSRGNWKCILCSLSRRGFLQKYVFCLQDSFQRRGFLGKRRIERADEPDPRLG